MAGDEALLNAGKQNIDKEKLERLLPRGTSHRVTDEIITLINNMENDCGLLQDYMEESLLTYIPVLREIKVDLKDYINAIKYCNLKKSMTNEKAWEITFPDRYKKLKDEDRKISSHVAMYNQSKIVTKLDAQMMVAAHIQYAPLFHEAIMKEASLMRGVDSNGNEVSPHVQHLAASTIIDKLAQPIEQKVDIKIGQSDEAKEGQTKMLNEMRTIARNQQELLKKGHKIEDIQKLNMTIEIENNDDDDDYIDIEEDEYSDFDTRIAPCFNDLED
jgi:hypothetical protein